jgi:co-chaperonin GroES (HSP10)
MTVEPLTTRAIRPMASHVLIEATPPAERSPGGVLLARVGPRGDRIERGRVVAVPDDCPGIKVGDEVLVPQYGGDWFEVDGKRLYAYRYETILARLDP